MHLRHSVCCQRQPHAGRKARVRWVGYSRRCGGLARIRSDGCFICIGVDSGINSCTNPGIGVVSGAYLQSAFHELCIPRNDGQTQSCAVA